MSFFGKNELYNLSYIMKKINFLIEIVEKALQNFDIMFILNKTIIKESLVFELIDIVFL